MIKEVLSPDDVEVLESDFSERVGEKANTLHFLTKMRNVIKHKQDCRYEMPQPFKGDRPDNKNFAF